MKKYVILSSSIVLIIAIFTCLYFLNLVISQQGVLIKDVNKNIESIIDNKISINKSEGVDKDKYYLFSYIDKNTKIEKIGLAVYRKIRYSPFYTNIRMEYNKENYSVDSFTEGVKGNSYTYLTIYGIDKSNKFSYYEVLKKDGTIKENVYNLGVFMKVYKLKNEIILDINMYDRNGKKI